jgi:hypothetical protein
MLRASSQVEGNLANLASLVEGAGTESDVASGEALLHFAEVALDDDQAAITQARHTVIEAMGEAAMIDAAGIIANFQRMVRIADGTGIPLDEPVVMVTQALRSNLGLNQYGSADNTPTLALPKKLLGKMLSPILPVILKYMVKSRT